MDGANMNAQVLFSFFLFAPGGLCLIISIEVNPQTCPHNFPSGD